MKRLIRLSFVLMAMVSVASAYGQKTSGNPIFEGTYADPEGVIFGKTYWIYPTWSVAFKDQLHLDAFSSKDLVKWTKHERIIDNSRIKWLRNALWAPAAIEKDGKYYLFFSGNNIQNNNQYGGIGIAVADSPEGPFEDYLGKPLIDQIVNRAQPIDQFVFKDKDDSVKIEDHINTSLYKEALDYAEATYGAEDADFYKAQQEFFASNNTGTAKE